ncbi:uracil-DNA glycosylase [Mycoplasma sp. 888]|uniref:uracil-DNA glycosylase n=1 Tax=Mycoplasma sp. 888 TaxID=3108483 RepID=UPI002D799B1B|nr:uracil-DNA glycosylase [Mycoplasma sp. 888]WRQ26067.1 uracil-DNA glycosylase [Mycoplasma sp. 888]
MKDSFLKILQSEGQKPYFTKILDKLKEEETNGVKVFPHQMDLFKPFEFFQVNETKVIILGQDPYHTLGLADGLAFSTYDDKFAPSLNNMFKELKKDYPKTKLETTSLVSWAKQGVLLLNTVLTVAQNKPASHFGIGWETFTHKVVEEVVAQNPNVMVVALGKKAQQFIKDIPINPKNLVELAHPSPYSYNKGFADSHLFKTINKKLEQNNVKPIKWDLTKGEK